MELLWWPIGGAFVVLVAYLATRAASLAYFRTKLEYFKSVVREGERNGNRKN